MSARTELPEELVECLELYRDGRCPELAACLFEELAAHSRRTESDTERCLCYLLLRNWRGVDRTRRDLPAPRAVPSSPAAGSIAAEERQTKAVSGHAASARSRRGTTRRPALRLVHGFTRDTRS